MIIVFLKLQVFTVIVDYYLSKLKAQTKVLEVRFGRVLISHIA